MASRLVIGNQRINNLARWQPKAVAAVANVVAWTPCRHYQQALGCCPLCWFEYLIQEDKIQPLYVAGTKQEQ